MRKRYLRELRSNKGRYAAIFTVIFVLIGFISSFYIAQGSVEKIYRDSWKTGNVEDGQITTNRPLAANALLEFPKHNCTYEKAFFREFELSGKTYRIFQNRESINKPALFEGRFAKEKGEIAIERLFAKNNGYSVGDTIKIGGDSYKIVGIAALPDYSSLIKSSSDFLMNNDDFCLGLVSSAQFDSIDEGRIIYRYSYVYGTDAATDTNVEIMSSEQGHKPQSVKDKVEHIKKLAAAISLRGGSVADMSIADFNSALHFVEDDMGGDVPMFTIMMMLALMIVAFVFAAISRATLEDEAPIIGTLLAMGYSRKEIIKHYMKLPLFVTLISCIVGNIAAYAFVKDIYFDLYYNSYSLFPKTTVINPRAFAITTLTPIALVLVINYITLARKLRFSIIDFLRGNLTHAASREAVELKKLSFPGRVRMRMFIANINVYVVLSCGVLIANILLMYGLSVKPLIENYMNDLDDRMHYSYQYDLRAPLPEDQMLMANVSDMPTAFWGTQSIGGIVSSEDENFSRITNVGLSANQRHLKRELGVRLFGISEDNRYFKDYNLQYDEVYISEGVSKRLKVDIGDDLILDDKIRGKQYEFRIVGINDYSAGLAVFASQQYVNRLLGFNEYYYNSLMSDEALDLPEEIVTRSMSADTIKNMGNQITKVFRDISKIILVLAITIYIAVYYVLTKIVLDRSRRQIAYLKIFGYTNSEIRKFYVTTSTIVLILISTAVIPLLWAILPQLMQLAMAKIDGYIPVQIEIWRFVAASGAGVLIYLTVNLINLRKIRKIDMNEALKVSTG